MALDILAMNNTSQTAVTVPGTAGGTVLPTTTIPLSQNNYKLVKVQVIGVLTTATGALAQNVIFELRAGGTVINQTNPITGTGGPVDITIPTTNKIDNLPVTLIFDVTVYQPTTLTVTMRAAGADINTTFLVNSVLAVGFS